MPSVSELLLSQYQAWRRRAPSRWRQRRRKGVDCSGLVQLSFGTRRMDCPGPRAIRFEWAGWWMRGRCAPGDLVYFMDKGGDQSA